MDSRLLQRLAVAFVMVLIRPFVRRTLFPRAKTGRPKAARPKAKPPL